MINERKSPWNGDGALVDKVPSANVSANYLGANMHPKVVPEWPLTVEEAIVATI